MRRTGPTGVALMVALLVLGNAGCISYRSYQEGTTKYTSLSLGTNQAVAPFELEAGKKDDASYRKLKSQGLTNDNSTVIEAAVSAAVRAAKP